MDSISIQSEPTSRVLGNLWMGGVPPIGNPVSKHFDCLVLAAMEYQCPWDYPGVEVALAPLNDDGSPMTRDEMSHAVRTAGRVSKWLIEGKSVLVTCRMGKNRSGLICALTLCCGPTQLTPDQAVVMIREARGRGALGNRQFLAFLKEFCQMRADSSKEAGKLRRGIL